MNDHWVNRVINLLIIFCLLLIPVGCASSSYDAEDDLSFMEQYEDDPANDAIAPASSERTSIKLLFPGYQPRNWNDVKDETEKRIRKTLNISLDFKWKEQFSYISEIKTLQASNQNFDAFVIAAPDESSPDFTKLARSGVLKDITDIFPESAPSLYKKYSNEELAYATIDSKLYAVPSLYTIAESPSIITIDSLLKKYKIDDITDFEQYEAFLKMIRENEPTAIPGIDTATFIASLPSVLGYVVADEQAMLVYKRDDPEMRLMAWEKTPEFYDTVNMYIGWFEKGYLKPANNGEDYFKASSVLIGGYLAPPSKKAEKMTVSSTLGSTMEIGPVRLLRFYPDKKVQKSNPMGNYGVNGSFAFPKESKNTEMVLRFLEWVQHDRDNYNLVVNGIEKKDYVMNDGKPELPQGMNALSSSYMYWGGHWAFKNSEYENAESKARSIMEYTQSHSEYPPHGVFYPEYGMLEQTAGQRAKGLLEFYGRLSWGQIKTADQVDKFIRDMEAYGTNELIAEVQSQLTGQ